jgi:hypothetical protein
VSLPPTGGDLSATDPDGNLGQYGPAFIFENHGALTVHSTGSTGPGGSVTSSASVKDIQDNDPFHAHGPNGEVSSTCTASGTGLSGSARIVNGRLVTSVDVATGNPASEVVFPPTWDPEPNTTYTGTLDTVGDTWRMVFNEQVVTEDSITVNAVHMYLLGPTAVGDMIIGQSHCGVTPPPVAPRSVVADFTGDGKTDYSVYRPSTGAWYVAGGTNAAWGTPGDAPVPGDYNGDAKTDFAVYRPSTGAWYVALAGGGVTSASWGAPGDVPVPGDYNGDASTDFGVYRPSTGAWYVALAGGGVTSASWGIAGDVPQPGDYNGDASADFAVFRPSTGAWFVAGGNNADWGVPGDIALPLPLAIHNTFFPSAP